MMEREDMTMVRVPMTTRSLLRQIARTRGMTMQGVIADLVRREAGRVRRLIDAEEESRRAGAEHG